MKIEFDLAKSQKNALERGLPFTLVNEFDRENAVFSEDARFHYPETRVVALGFLRRRLHVDCFTSIAAGVRIISFGKANGREVRRYEKQKTTDK